MKYLQKDRLVVTIPVLLGVVSLVLATYIWFEKVYFSPSNVFERMLMTSLSQSGYGKQVSSEQPGQTLRQANMINTIGVQQTTGETRLTYGMSEESQTKVTTQALASGPEEFVRYTELNVSGGNKDFKNVLGRWAYTPTQPDTKANNTYNETMFSSLPQGYLPAQKRSELVDFAINEKLFSVDFSNSTVSYNGIRPRRTFDVTMTAQNYIRYLKRYAELSGTPGLEIVKPEEFAGSSDIHMELTVDVLTSRLVTINVPSVGRKEDLTSHGAVTQIDKPKTTLKIEELQSLLQAQ